MQFAILDLFKNLTPVAQTFYNSEEGARYAWQKIADAYGGGPDSMFTRWLNGQFGNYWARYQNDVMAHDGERNPNSGSRDPAAPVLDSSSGGSDGTPPQGSLKNPINFTDWLNDNAGDLGNSFQMLDSRSRGANPGRFQQLGGRALW